eukprot:scaffold28162_cov49-Phaeocystis_antarctica.AAC.1
MYSPRAAEGAKDDALSRQRLDTMQNWLRILVSPQPISSHPNHRTTPTQVRRVRVRAHLRVPRLPTPRLPAPRLPAPWLPAPRLPSRCLPRLHRLTARRIRTREACRPASTTPPTPSLLACAKRCPRDSSNLPPCATLATLCDSAPTPSVLRSRRPTRMACHLSPPSRGEPSQSFPAPCSAERDFPNSLNYQGLRPAFATTRLPF